MVTPQSGVALVQVILLSAALSVDAASQPPRRAAVPECWGAEDRSRSFTGQMTTNEGTIREQIGARGTERVVQKVYGDLRVCMVTHGFDGDRADQPSEWSFRSDGVILETRTPNDVRTLLVSRRNGVIHIVNGDARPLDAAAREWRESLLGLLDVTWELMQWRGRESALRGQISSIEGERSSLQGRISSLRGQVSSMQGEISSLRGQVSSMQGEISSIRGHESSLRGAISSEQGAISSLRNMSWERARDIDVEARIQRHEENIQRIERQIREYDADSRVRQVERRIEMFDVETRVAAVERRIRAFDVEAKVAPIQKLLDGRDIDSRIARVEAEISSMDIPGRTRDLEQRRDEALARLRRTLP